MCTFFFVYCFLSHFDFFSFSAFLVLERCVWGLPCEMKVSFPMINYTWNHLRSIPRSIYFCSPVTWSSRFLIIYHDTDISWHTRTNCSFFTYIQSWISSFGLLPFHHYIVHTRAREQDLWSISLRLLFFSGSLIDSSASQSEPRPATEVKVLIGLLCLLCVSKMIPDTCTFNPNFNWSKIKVARFSSEFSTATVFWVFCILAFLSSFFFFSSLLLL